MIQQQPQSQQQLHTSKITIPINNIASSSSSSVSTGTQANNNHAQTTAINTEEFAKLDALLEDLLAEVEQPILLNKCNESLSKNDSFASPRNITTNNKGPDEVEKSVDWLNEQKEILRSRKELNPAKHSAIKIGDTNLSYTNGSNESHFQEFKSDQMKFSNVNGTLNQSTTAFSERNDDESQVASLTGALNGYMTGYKPPLSPNSQRHRYSPTQSQPQQPHQQQSFRSLSTNPTLLRNINETDDEINMIESEFDRYSQRSFRSNAGTVQRSKYHTVSNDFVECTRPPALTPVPSSSYQSKVSNPGKRALSAPPVELGKVMLQRMELKSPVTIRQGSAIPFENQPKMIQYEPQVIQQRVQTPINTGNRYFDNNVYSSHNNRGILKSQHNQNMIQYQPQQIPTRNVFLNKSYVENPRIAYTNGYETDSGIPHSYGTYRGNQAQTYGQHSQIYAGDRMYAPRKTNIMNGYRTIGGSSSRSYTTTNDQQGYETDTGLIKLRTALDNRRALSRNDLPIQQQQQVMPHRPFYQGRSITPSFNYNYNQQMQQQYRANPYTNHINTPVQDPQFVINTYSNEIDNMDILNNGQFLDNTDFNQQYQQYNTNNEIIENMDGDNNAAYLTEDGQQIFVNEMRVDEIPNNFNGTLDRHGHQPISQSMIIHQQRAPSAYSVRENPSRLGYTSSATNLSFQPQQPNLNGQLSTSQQITRQENRPENGSRRSSANSLATDPNDVMRNHPKSVKNTQNFWYKPKISRDEAINLLKDKQPGTFLIRDSNNFPGAYGLALKVDKPPSNVQIKPGSDPLNELVRHFLIEPTTKGVRIKGCYNEPIFGSLAALAYQHSLTPLALPIKLNLPQEDLVLTYNQSKNNQSRKAVSNVSKSNNQEAQNSVQDARHLLDKGAACHVYYLATINVGDKNGLEAITHALSINKAFQTKDNSQLVVIQFKVTSQGITLTDIQKKKFLRNHFPTNTVSYCAIEEKLVWPTKLDKISKPRIFGVITKPNPNSNSNECHLFIELDQDQPAIAIVDFINRYLIPSKVKKN